MIARDPSAHSLHGGIECALVLPMNICDMCWIMPLVRQRNVSALQRSKLAVVSAVFLTCAIPVVNLVLSAHGVQARVRGKGSEGFNSCAAY